MYIIHVTRIAGKFSSAHRISLGESARGGINSRVDDLGWKASVYSRAYRTTGICQGP